MRNPSRTAATAAALMVGVTLVSLMTRHGLVRQGLGQLDHRLRRCEPTSSSAAAAISAAAPAASARTSSARSSALPQVSADVAGIRSGVVQIYGQDHPDRGHRSGQGGAAVQHRASPRAAWPTMTASGIARVDSGRDAASTCAIGSPVRGDLPDHRHQDLHRAGHLQRAGDGGRLRPAARRRRGEFPAGPRHRRLRQARPGRERERGPPRDRPACSPPTRTPR